MNKSKITVLIFTPYFLPGYKAGGPIRSLKNLIDHLSDKIHFKVITPDHDLGDTKPYDGIVSDAWNKISGIDTYYISDNKRNFFQIAKIIRNTNHDIRYYNSFFYPYLTIFPLLAEKLRLITHKPSVLAPRGELAPAALQSSKNKKKPYLKFVHFFKLYERLHWQVTSKFEKTQLLNLFPIKSDMVAVIANLPPKIKVDLSYRHSNKQIGKLRLVFVSRIAPKKNLLGALDFLRKVKGQITFDIYGPKEDKNYFDKCMKQKEYLPHEIVVNYRGPLKHEQIEEVLRQYDFLFFPSFDENFGHIILESFIAGTPVIISDRTPWLDLDRDHAGWAIPLEDNNLFVHILNECVRMDRDTHQQLCNGALRKAQMYLNNARLVEQTYEMFAKLVV